MSLTGQRRTDPTRTKNLTRGDEEVVEQFDQQVRSQAISGGGQEAE